MARKEIGCKEMDWKCLSEYRHIWWGLENTTVNLWVLNYGLLLGKLRNQKLHVLSEYSLVCEGGFERDVRGLG